jgi:protocatechuate 3,4-dioxygenase beta subunit
MSSSLKLIAQESTEFQDEISTDYKKRSPIYDYSEMQLNDTDTIADFDTQNNKLKLTGIIYQSDGVTPAKDVMLYIEQADSNGEYQIKTKNDKRYLEHRAWVKTNEKGEYTLYTFVPGSAIVPITMPRRKGPKQIFPIVKEPGKKESNLEAFMFDDDPLITKSCRKRLKRKGIDCILKLEKQGDMFVVNKDIVLN